MSRYALSSIASDRPGYEKSIRLAQNFLRNPDLAKTLVCQAKIAESDIVYEIGPGRGILTRALAAKAGKIIAIEKDQNLFSILKREFSSQSNVILHLGDFFRFRIAEREFKVFANIPFNMTARIVKELVSRPLPPKDAYLIMQKESAEKFAGRPRNSLFNVMNGPWLSFQILQTIDREEFCPNPNVDAALLHIGRRVQPLLPRNQAAAYRKFVRYGFSGWKPNLRTAYRNAFTYFQWKRLAKDLGFDMEATCRELSLEQWIGLFSYHLKDAGLF